MLHILNLSYCVPPSYFIDGDMLISTLKSIAYCRLNFKRKYFEITSFILESYFQAAKKLLNSISQHSYTMQEF